MIKNIDNISGISAQSSTQKQVIYGNNNTNASIIGVMPAYEKVNNTSVSEGTFITENAYTNRDKVAVLGPTVVTNLF